MNFNTSKESSEAVKQTLLRKKDDAHKANVLFDKKLIYETQDIIK